MTAAAGDLKVQWVVHCVAPSVTHGAEKIWEKEEDLLRQTYDSIFARCREVGATSVAMPAIGAGANGWPAGAAAEIAMRSLAAQEEGQAVAARGAAPGAAGASPAVELVEWYFVDDSVCAAWEHAHRQRREAPGRAPAAGA